LKDEQTILVIQSINQNDSLTPETKLDLTAKIMKDCQQKKIGEIIMDAVTKKDAFYPDGPLKKPVKRGRGRPKKTENQIALTKSVKEDSQGDF